MNIEIIYSIMPIIPKIKDTEILKASLMLSFHNNINNTLFIMMVELENKILIHPKDDKIVPIIVLTTIKRIVKIKPILFIIYKVGIEGGQFSKFVSSDKLQIFVQLDKPGRQTNVSALICLCCINIVKLFIS